MTYIDVFNIHQIQGAFWGVKDLTEVMTMFCISKSIVNRNVLPQMKRTGGDSGNLLSNLFT